MDIVFRQCILVNNDCYKAGRYIKPKGIMMHSTGANNPRLKRYVDTHDGYTGPNLYGNDWNRPGVGACVHAFIGLAADDSVGIVQTLPWDMRGWHCGASGNDTHISFEICEDGLADPAYFRETRDASAKLCAYLCKLYGWDPLAPGVLIDHAEGYDMGIASGHSDVGHWWKKHSYTMASFRRLVADLMAADIKPEPVPAPPAADPDPAPYDARAAIELLQAHVEALEGKLASYTTLLDIPSWARPEIKRLCMEGIIQGDKNGNLNIPKQALQAYLLMARVLERVESKEVG